MISLLPLSKLRREVPNGTAAGLLLIEHLWAKKFKEIARKQHGVLLANGFITPEALVAAGVELAEGTLVAEKAFGYYQEQGGLCL